MTKKETAQLLFILKEYYPNSLNNSNLENRVMAWYLVLKDHDYQMIQNAMVAFVTTDTKGFMPSVGQLVEKAMNITKSPEMSEMEAWHLVAKALRNSTYGAEEEYEKLPDSVKRSVGSPSQLREWATMPADEVHTVISSNFQRSFRAIAKQEKDYQALPESVKEFMAINTGIISKQIPMGCTGMGKEELAAIRKIMERQHGEKIYDNLPTNYEKEPPADP